MLNHGSDILKFAAAWGITTAIILICVNLNPKSPIPRTIYSAFVIAIRLLFVYALTFAILSVCFGIPVDAVLIACCVVLALSPLARLDLDIPSRLQVLNLFGEQVGIALWLTVMIPVYIVQQFVLGFPDHDEVVLVPPVHAEREELPDLMGAVGTVTATLRPWGKVEVAGVTYSATTADGKLLDRGVAVCVTEVRNAVLVVVAVERSDEPFN